MTPDTPRSRRGGLAFAVIILATATVVAGYLVLHHVRSVGDPFYSRVCNPSHTWLGLPLACDDVAQSAFGSLAGVPISVLGVAFYLVLLGLAALAYARRDALGQRALSLLWGGTLFAVAYAAVLLVAQVLVIHAFCPFCLALYGLHVALLAAVLWSAGLSPKACTRTLARTLLGGLRDPLFLVAAGGFAVAATLGALANATLAKPSGPPIEQLRERLAQIPTLRVPTSTSDAAEGPSDAPYVVVEFSDFLCPFCRVAARDLKTLRERTPELRVVFKHFPLDAECNPYVLTTVHPGACLAATATVCAGRGGKFWPMHDWLFDGGSRGAPDTLRARLLVEASHLGLNEGEFARCLDDGDVAAALLDDIELAVELGVRTTPALLLNGRPFYRPPLELGSGAVAAIATFVLAGELKRQ